MEGAHKAMFKSTCPHSRLCIKPTQRALNNKNTKFPPLQTPGLKVIGLSEPKLTQSLSQSSSADARPPLPPSSPGPQRPALHWCVGRTTEDRRR